MNRKDSEFFDAKNYPEIAKLVKKGLDKLTSAERIKIIRFFNDITDRNITNVDDLKNSFTMFESKNLNESNKPQILPNMVVLRRIAIRVFPDGLKVGLYYGDTIDKFVTIPFETVGTT